MGLKLSDLKSFLTGSHCYGTPHEQSDIDLVVLLTPEDLTTLKNVRNALGQQVELAEADDYGGGDGETANLHFGRLNLICCTDYRDFEVWRHGTDQLIAESLSAPVSRTRAVDHFRKLRAEAKGIKELT